MSPRADAPVGELRDRLNAAETAVVLAAVWRVFGRRRTMLRAGMALALSSDSLRTLGREQDLDDEPELAVVLRLACERELP